MRLDLPRLRERFGAVLIYGLQTVYELDSGVIEHERKTRRDAAIQRVPYEDIHAAMTDMAIVIPVRDEKLRLLEGVLAGVPNACQVILVSGSERDPVDRFQLEKDMIETISTYNNRPIICVHQRDPLLAKAFEAAGYTDILGDDGLVRRGKAEGMIVGTMMAWLSGKKSIGFIDSDNYFPGAVLEYCHIYASGIAMSRKRPYSMVRISWSSKPKVVESELYFAKWGRSSVITNAFLNQLTSNYTGFETEAIRTGNAGEHGMTLDLAMNLGFSSGYSIEPYQWVYLMEKFGGMQNPVSADIMNKHVHVYQIESRNPHLHEYKGEEHVEKMIESSLSVIYHSALATPRLREDIEEELVMRKIKTDKAPPVQLRQYPRLASMDLEAFRQTIAREAQVLNLQDFITRTA